MNGTEYNSSIRRFRLLGKAGVLSLCALSAAAWGQTGGATGANAPNAANQGPATSGAQTQSQGGQFTPRTGGGANNGTAGGTTAPNGTGGTTRPGGNRANGQGTTPNAGATTPAVPNGSGTAGSRNTGANAGTATGNAVGVGNNRGGGGTGNQNAGTQNSGANAGQNQKMTANALGARIQATPDGLVVRSVKPGSPAALAGLKEGDVISGIGGTPVQTQADLDRLLSTFPLGSTVDFAGMRNGQLVTSPVALPQSVPGTGTTTTTTQSNSANGSKNNNSSGQAAHELLPSDIGWELQDKDRRVWITSVTPGTFADDAGFKEGDLITQIDKTDITKAAAVQYKLSTVEPGVPALVKIERDKVPMTIRLHVPAAPVSTATNDASQQGGGQQTQTTTTTVEAARPNLLRAELIRRLEIQEEVLKKTLVELQTIRAELETAP